MQRVMITGANRGIGLAFVRQYLERGAMVFAACRSPEDAADLHDLKVRTGDRLHIIKLDVGELESIQVAHEAVQALTDGLERLVNNAAVFPQVPFGDLTFETSMNTLRINAVAPMMIVQTFFDLLKNGNKAVILNIASNRASISEKTDTKLVDYSASKAALNMYSRSIAAIGAEHSMKAVMIDPGWVQTRMGGMEADLTPDKTVRGMINIVENLTDAQNGGFFNWDGTTHAW